MGRIVIAVIAGMIVAVAVVAGIEALSHTMFPPPPGTDLSDPAQMAALMDNIPLVAKIAVMIAWFLGPLAGGIVAVRIARKAWPAWVVAALIVYGGIYTIVQIPHPLWMQAGAVLLPALAARLAGRSIANRRELI